MGARSGACMPLCPWLAFASPNETVASRPMLLPMVEGRTMHTLGSPWAACIHLLLDPNLRRAAGSGGVWYVTPTAMHDAACNTTPPSQLPQHVTVQQSHSGTSNHVSAMHLLHHPLMRHLAWFHPCLKETLTSQQVPRRKRTCLASFSAASLRTQPNNRHTGIQACSQATSCMSNRDSVKVAAAFVTATEAMPTIYICYTLPCPADTKLAQCSSFTCHMTTFSARLPLMHALPLQ